MNNQIPTITTTLNVTPDFTGRVLVYVENGSATSNRRLPEDDFVAGLNTFLDLARKAGWSVIPPDDSSTSEEY